MDVTLLGMPYEKNT